MNVNYDPEDFIQRQPDYRALLDDYDVRKAMFGAMRKRFKLFFDKDSLQPQHLFDHIVYGCAEVAEQVFYRLLATKAKSVRPVNKGKGNWRCGHCAAGVRRQHFFCGMCGTRIYWKEGE